jgi:hypothetical protein
MNPNTLWVNLNHLRYSGHAKITAPRPSTSFFGNDGIYQTLKMLQHSNPDVAIHGEPFMGKPKDKVRNPNHVLVVEAELGCMRLYYLSAVLC